MPTFYTEITAGAAANAATFNDPLDELDTALAVAHDADGTLKAGAVDVAAVLAADVVTTAKILDANVTTAKIADANVTAAKLAAAVAGDGLSGGAGSALAVNVDNSTVELSSDALRVKDAGITAAKLAAAVSGGITGGANATAQLLKQWTEAEAYEATSITYSTTYPDVVSTATVKWPDGSAGTFTATTINSTFIAIDAYTLSHVDSGKTVTQAAVTRNTAGQITTKPALTVAP